MTDTQLRIQAIRERLSDSGHGAFVARTVANVSYLTDFAAVWDSEPFSLVVITQSDAMVVTDSRFKEAATQAAVGTPYGVHVAAGGLWAAVASLFPADAPSAIAVESSLPYSVLERARTDFACDLVPVDDWVETLRTSKSAEEISRIAEAQSLTDRAFDHILGFIRAGVSEREVALELEFFMRREGSDGVAFDPIVASGPNSALPHATPSLREVKSGDFIVLDFGARVDGYCADMTRTVVVGTPTEQQRTIYSCVLEANLAGIAAVAADKPGSAIDAEARGIIEAAGFGALFGHGLGHGVGREVHEAPGVGQRSVDGVPLWSVVTIEPGIYIPGVGGVRIEDLVVVEKDSCRVLTQSTKELIEL